MRGDPHTVDVDFLTKEDEHRLLYGVVYEPMIPDAQGDFASPEVIEDAAHRFMLDFQRIGIMHKADAPAIRIVESYVAPCDMTVNDEPVLRGSWVLVVKVLDDDAWEAVKRGELTGFSLQGYGEAAGDEAAAAA